MREPARIGTPLLTTGSSGWCSGRSRLPLVAALLSISTLTVGCGEGRSDQAPTQEAVRLEFEPPALRLHQGEAAAFAVLATGEDGSRHDVTEAVDLVTDSDDIEIGMGEITGSVVGETTITATLGTLTASAAIIVDEAPWVELSLLLDGETDLQVGTTARLHVVGRQERMQEGKVERGVVFTSSNERVATVDGEGHVEVLAGGPVTFRAEVGGLVASLDAHASCVYPAHSPTLEHEKGILPLSWMAKSRDGTEFELALRDVHCNEEWAETKTLLFVLSAGWCPACTSFLKERAKDADQLLEAGMQIVIVQVEESSGDPGRAETAYAHVSQITPNVPGIVVGDLETKPQSRYFGRSKMLRSFPTSFIVRKSDMKIISEGSLPLKSLLDISRNPERYPRPNWEAPAFVNLCGPEDEEGSEPNDTSAQAASLLPGVQEGGICAEGSDFYRVELEGPWTLRLDFSNDVGNLDLFAWDTTRNQVLIRNSKLIGSKTDSDREEFDSSGPATVVVMPRAGASAPYRLTLMER